MAESILRLFPLTGTLLLPGTYLPLNVFEERYRNMVGDALEGDKRIAIIQPLLPGPDNFGIVQDAEKPALYGVGCVGHIVECELQPDGRYWLVLKGEQRFRVLDELAEEQGYRRALADLDIYAQDLSELEEPVAVRPLFGMAQEWCRQLEFSFDTRPLEGLPPAQALNALCVSLPLEPIEKQALLEAGDAEARLSMLRELVTMQLSAPALPPEDSTPPMVN